MWSVSLKHYKCKEDSSGSYIIHDGRLRAGYARVVTRQGVEWRKMTKNTLQYFEDEADYRLLLVSMQVSIIILILRAESPILKIKETTEWNLGTILTFYFLQLFWNTMYI